MDLTRLQIEAEDLGVKISNLEAFLHSNKFETLPTDMKMAMAVQHNAMENYLKALTARIKLGS